MTTQTTPTKESIEVARELVEQGAATLGGKFAIQIIDLALSTFGKTKKEEIKNDFRKPEERYFKSFQERFEKDNCENMSDDQWGEWVNALPKEEFAAMLHLDTRP